MFARLLRVLIIICWSSAVFPVWGAGVLFTVAHVGGGDYSSIQAAINAASSNDTVVVLDTAYYDEQVTFDSTKNGMVLRSLYPESSKKPTIRWKDTVHIHPVSCAESQGGVIDYDQNGALRFLACRNVTVDGIVVDGDAVYPFGEKQIWGITPGSPYCMYDLQHGNTAIALLAAGGITIRNCDVAHAYFGIYTKDRNPDGLYAILRPDEDGYLESCPGSKLGKSGGHVFERNRIHNNSFGMFFESCLDLGNIVRFNCIYENHHPTGAIALYVKNLTIEGSNQPGGAFMVKDCLVAPIAIYNNTFWHNSLSIVGGWRPGNQYLQYNNIWAQPNEYWQDGMAGDASFMVLHQSLTNRMYSSVFGAQEYKPVRYSYRVSAFDSLAGVFVFDSLTYTTLPAGVINNMGTIEMGVSSVAIPLSDGTVVEQQLRTQMEGNRIIGTASKIFADTQNVRWVEVKFKSEDPADPDFLVPNWSDTLIQRCVIDKGMTVGGYDADGSLADIGAFSSTASPAPSLSLIPLKAAVITNGTASLQFYLAATDGPIQECTVSYLRLIGVKPNLGGFGGGELPIPPASMVDIALPMQPITGGENRLSVSVPQLVATFEYAFFEMVVRGVTASGEHISTVGFIPYRVLKDTILVTGPGTIKAGVAATATLKGTGKYSSGFFKDVQITLLSGMEILDTMGLKINAKRSFIDHYQWNFSVGKFSGAQKDTLLISGSWYVSDNGSPEVVRRVVPVSYQYGLSRSVRFTTPFSNSNPAAPTVLTTDTTFMGTITIADKFGNQIKGYKHVVLSASDSTKARFGTASFWSGANDSGFVSFPLTLTGKKGESVKLYAILTYYPDSADADVQAVRDTAEIWFGDAYDRLAITYVDSSGQETEEPVSAYIGSRISCTIWATTDGKTVARDRTDSIIVASAHADSLKFYLQKTGGNPVTLLAIDKGKVDMWIESKYACSDAGFTVVALDDSTLLRSCRYGLYFVEAPVRIVPRYRLPVPVAVTIEAFSLSGRRVAAVETKLNVPYARWAVARATRSMLASGTYVVQIKQVVNGRRVRPVCMKLVVGR